MFDKLLEAQQKAGEVKKRLDGITVWGDAEGGKIKVWPWSALVWRS